MNHKIRMFRAGTLAMLVQLAFNTVLNAQDFSRTAPTIAAKIASSGKKAVAVVDFTDLQMNVTELGRYLAEEFQGALVNQAQGFRVVDRTHLKAIIQENKLATTGIIDPQTARQLGRIAGVDALVTGSITPLGDSVRLSLKVLDATSADVIAMSSMDVPKTAAITLLIDQTIGRIDGVGPGARSTERTPPVRLTTSMANVQIDLILCRRSGTSVICEFRLAAKGSDTNVFFGMAILNDSGFRAYDDAGVVHHVVAIELARQKADRYVSGRLISEVPTSLVTTFDRFDAGVQTISALYIAGGVEGGPFHDDLVLRNIPIK